MTTPGGRSADEVNELMRTITAWAQRALPAPPSGHGGPECEWCPLCQLASALRGEYPEVTERMAEAGAVVAGAIRSLLESAPIGFGAKPPPPPAASVDDPPRRRPRPRIERIVLDDETGGA